MTTATKTKKTAAVKTASKTLAHVHETREAIASVELTPPHGPRVETPEYAKAHSFLINKKNSPCQVCGVTKRTLRNASKNPFGAALPKDVATVEATDEQIEQAAGLEQTA